MVRSLDEEVGVRVLQRVVDEPEIAAVASSRETAFERTDEARRTQRGEPGKKLHGDVRGEARDDSLATAVRHARSEPGLPAGSESTAAPAMMLFQTQAELSVASVHRFT